MKRHTIILWTVPILITAAMLIAWQATGGDAYTKFTVVERVAVQTDADDPLAGTGMFEAAEPRYETLRRDEFRLGLLPTPQGLFDKHVISVVSVVGPVWILFLGGWWLRKKMAACASCAPSSPEIRRSSEAGG